MNPSICECLTLLQCIMPLRPLLPVLWLDGPMGLIQHVTQKTAGRLQLRQKNNDLVAS